jgi:hypothetical protein
MPTKQKAAVNTAASGRTHAAPAENANPTGPRRWTVTIPYVPPTVVEAADEAEAWDKFKARWGIVKSEHVPAITAVSSQ